MFSDGFERLYCDASVFEPFSTSHPVSFARVLPFQPDDPVVDDPGLLGAEAAHLAARNDLTRGEVIDAYARCGLLSAEDAANVKSVIDLYGADFFDLMGLVYANAGMSICALRWYREFIRELEAQGPEAAMDSEGVYASVGYCLYALGLFEEAIAWTKSCVGPRLTADAICEALLDYEAQRAGGRLRGVERVGFRTRYTLSATDPATAGESTPQLKAALKTFAPGQEFHLDWITEDASLPASLESIEAPADDESSPGHEPLFEPVKIVRDISSLPRHKLNLIFASHAWAEVLYEKNFFMPARQLLYEAVLLEPSAAFIQSRLRTLGP
jgi:hypothetical protein